MGSGAGSAYVDPALPRRGQGFPYLMHDGKRRDDEDLFVQPVLPAESRQEADRRVQANPVYFR